MKAVITAGGRVGEPYSSAAGTDVKALARVRGATMLDRSIDALRGAGAVRIAVVGGSAVRDACSKRVERVIDESPSGAQNVLRALRAWPDDDGEPLLYATSDMPYVTAGAIGDFVTRVPSGAIALALAEFADFAIRFPGAPPFGINLARERVVNGGIFSLPAGSCSRIARFATLLFEARKRPWRMATLVSPLAMLRLLLGRLSIAEIESVAGKAANVPAAAVRRCAPELGFDADTLAEYRYACQNP
ncbi:MAG: nucleotidyltransferase family protein [Candidatus Tumulicola sp.]